jgi:hypothetical protein
MHADWRDHDHGSVVIIIWNDSSPADGTSDRVSRPAIYIPQALNQR